MSVIGRLLTLLLTALIASPAVAGIKATYSKPIGRQIVIEVTDNGDARISDSKSQKYGLLIGDTFYTVFPDTDGHLQAARAADISDVLKKMLPARDGNIFPAVEMTIEKRGQRQVAGRMGTVYLIKSDKVAVEYVLSDDLALAPVGRALQHYVEATLVAAGEMFGTDPDAGIANSRRIFALGTLIEGYDVRLERLETTAVDPSRVTLPSAPMTVDEITEKFQAMTSGPSVDPSDDP